MSFSEGTAMLIQKVGETAGTVWHALETGGPQKLVALKKQTKANDAVLYMALGWLAREDKIDMAVDGRSYRVSLK
jgi:hypothetical protein